MWRSRKPLWVVRLTDSSNLSLSVLFFPSQEFQGGLFDQDGNEICGGDGAGDRNGKIQKVVHVHCVKIKQQFSAEILMDQIEAVGNGPEK